MKIIILGAAGFLGTNLALELAKNNDNQIILVDKNIRFFNEQIYRDFHNIVLQEFKFDLDSDYEHMLQNVDIVYHLVSTTVPTTSNQHIPQELQANVVMTSKLLEACVKSKIKKIIFFSSGGTVYGKEDNCPIREEMPTYPISSYGVQKITIEKLLYLYWQMYGLDFRVIRLSNPYGKYQRPNGVLGVVTNFVYKALNNAQITVYGDGSVIRDYLYVDDAIKGIIKISNKQGKYKIYNLGCGYGTSVNEVIGLIENILEKKLNVQYTQARKVDVPVNFLDISRYEKDYGKLNPISLEEGIKKMVAFMKIEKLI